MAQHRESWAKKCQGHKGNGVESKGGETRKSAAASILDTSTLFASRSGTVIFNRHSIRFITLHLVLASAETPLKRDLSLKCLLFLYRRNDWVENESGKVKSFLVDVTDDSACNYCHNSAMTVLREGEIAFSFMDRKLVKKLCPKLMKVQVVEI